MYSRLKNACIVLMEFMYRHICFNVMFDFTGSRTARRFSPAHACVLVRMVIRLSW